MNEKYYICVFKSTGLVFVKECVVIDPMQDFRFIYVNEKNEASVYSYKDSIIIWEDFKAEAGDTLLILSDDSVNSIQNEFLIQNIIK